MTTTNPRDRETVQRLLRSHLPSGFPAEPARPLTVGDVACRLKSEHARGAERLTADELATTRSLLLDETSIADERLTGRRVHEILAATGAEMPPRYWIRFQRAAIEMLMGRNGGPSIVIACERQD